MRAGIVACVVAMLAGCGSEPALRQADESTEKPASGVLRISSEMQERLGLKLQSASKREVASALTTTGWLEAQPGKEVVVKSPVAGFVIAESGTPLPQIGQTLEKSQRLATLQVFLTPQEIAQLVIAKEDTDKEMEQSLVSMKLAEEQLGRLKVAKDAVAGTRLIDLQEIYERSKAAYRESSEKLPFLLKEPYDDLALVKPVRLDAPLAGDIVEVHVAPSQFVSQGDALWTIADWSTLWVRVPVFESDLPAIQRTATAEMAVPGTLQTIRLKPVRALQPTKPGLRTVELLYELPNPNFELRAGQAVSVNLPTGRESEQVVIPESAVLWDGLSNAWVYVRVDAESFRRQRIETGHTLGTQIVVVRGLSGDEEVVTVGAESLYGQEFKGSIQEDKD
jgi:RND family efflux transporter MFP subunit